MAFITCAFTKNWLVIAVIVMCLCTDYYCTGAQEVLTVLVVQQDALVVETVQMN
jgi:hypothetical protein